MKDTEEFAHLIVAFSHFNEQLNGGPHSRNGSLINTTAYVVNFVPLERRLLLWRN